MHNLTFVFTVSVSITLLQIILRVILSSLHIFITLGIKVSLYILIPKVCTEFAKKGTFYTGAQAFNNLPPHLKQVDSTVVLKTQLNDIIFQRTGKSFTVFMEC